MLSCHVQINQRPKQRDEGDIRSLLSEICSSNNRSRTRIAQMIGSSRETVTRLLTALRRRNIIQITSDSVVILDRKALENMLGANVRSLQAHRDLRQSRDGWVGEFKEES